MAKIQNAIVAIPGGSSAGDEPDGSAKLLLLFRNPNVKGSGYVP